MKRIARRTGLVLLAIALPLFLSCSRPAARPNVLLIVADDLG